jgi:hypothetical protein
VRTQSQCACVGKRLTEGKWGHSTGAAQVVAHSHPTGCYSQPPHLPAYLWAPSSPALHMQGAQRSSLWAGTLRNAAAVMQPARARAAAQATRASDRLLAALQLGQACLALAQAQQAAGDAAAGEQALRKAVREVRWVLAAGAKDLQRLAASGSGIEVRRVGSSGGGVAHPEVLHVDFFRRCSCHDCIALHGHTGCLLCAASRPCLHPSKQQHGITLNTPPSPLTSFMCHTPPSVSHPCPGCTAGACCGAAGGTQTAAG